MNRSFERILAVAGASAVLVVGIDAVSYAATGKALILGHTNTANRTTTVRNTGNGAALSLITKKSTFAPFTTNATGQVPNLNASKVDGVTANQIRGHYALISIAPSLAVSHSSGGVNVANPQTGIYCITVAGVNPTNTVATVTPDYFQDATVASATVLQHAIVEVDSVPAFCPTGTFEIRTFVAHVNVAGTPASTITAQAQPFFFVTPQ